MTIKIYCSILSITTQWENQYDNQPAAVMLSVVITKSVVHQALFASGCWVTSCYVQLNFTYKMAMP